MVLGIRNRSIEVITIHQIEDLLKHLPLLPIHLAGVIPIPQHQKKVVTLAQNRGSTEGLNQCRDVLAAISPADGQKRGALRLSQKGLHHGRNIR